jgi:hypothetical protein
MAITNKNTRLVHRKEWQMMTIAPTSASTSGAMVTAPDDGNFDYALYAYNASTFYLYSHDEDGWVDMPNPSTSFSGGGAGVCGAFNRWSANYYSSGLGTTTSVIVNSGLFNIGQSVVGQTIELLSGSNAGFRTTISSVAFDAPAIQTVVSSTTSSATFTVRSLAGIAVGQQVTGTNITAGTTVSSVNTTNNTVTLSANVSLTASQSVTFTGSTGLTALNLSSAASNAIDINTSFRITSGRHFVFQAYSAQSNNVFKFFDQGTLTWRGTQVPINPSVPSLTTNSTTGGSIAANTYYYVVVATNAVGDSITSPPLSVTTTGSTSAVTLSWNRIPGATSYKVYRSIANSFAGADVSVTSGTAGNLLITTLTVGSSTGFTSYTDNANAGSAGTPNSTTHIATASQNYLKSVDATYLPSTWGTDGRLISTFNYGETYMPSGTLGSPGSTQTATSGTAYVLNHTGKIWTTNQWTNYQVRITGGTGIGQVRTISANANTQLTVAVQTQTSSTVSASASIPVSSSTGIAVGQQITGNGISGMCVVASISGNTITASSAQTITSGTTLTFGVPWNTVPDGTSTYVIEGNEEALYLTGNNSTPFYKYSITNDQWLIMTARGAAAGAACMTHYIGRTNNTTWADETNIKDGRYIYSFVGSSNTTLHRFDITANAGLGAWSTNSTGLTTTSNNITASGASVTFTTGSASAVSHNLIYLRQNATNRFFKYDVVTNTMLPFSTNMYPESSTYVGNKIWIRNYQATVNDTSETLKWIYSLGNGNQFLHRLLVY